MPRRPRVHIDGIPLHIVQRGHNREPCFFAEEDYFRNIRPWPPLPAFVGGNAQEMALLDLEARLESAEINGDGFVAATEPVEPEFTCFAPH